MQRWARLRAARGHSTLCPYMLAALLALTAAPCAAAAAPAIDAAASSGNALDDLVDVLLLRRYNTRLVVLSTAALGVAAGLIGTFLLLRKRSLTGDALSHATLPGIAGAFILMVTLGGSGKSLPLLLAGAAIAGLAGVGCVLLIRGATRLKDDAALGIVLSVFFGLGIVLLGFVQTMPEGSAAGLSSFIYGKTASIVSADRTLILVAAAAVAAACAIFYKELTLLCFDEPYAAAQGWPVTKLDILMMALVTAVTVIGLQAVGLILVIALLIIPAAAARFWTDRMVTMLLGSALIGGLSGWLGSSLSALVERLPAGAVIVVTAAAIFMVSMVFGPSRGVLVRVLQQRRSARRIARQHLLRAFYERLERLDEGNEAAALDEPALLAARSWSPRELRRLLRRAGRHGLIEPAGERLWRLTEHGAAEAARVARNHRLWEIYLITHADIAPSHVDRDADQIEHVLAPDLIDRLEALLDLPSPELPVPPSPHAL